MVVRWPAALWMIALVVVAEPQVLRQLPGANYQTGAPGSCGEVCVPECGEACSEPCFERGPESDECAECAAEQGCAACLECLVNEQRTERRAAEADMPAPEPVLRSRQQVFDQESRGVGVCDACRASIKMIWDVSLDGPRKEPGVAKQLGEGGKGRLQSWDKVGPDGIAQIIEAVCDPEVLPQRYHPTRLGPGEYALVPINAVVGSTARDGPYDTTKAGGTGPLLAMSAACRRMADKAGLQRLADRIMKIHSASAPQPGGG